MVASLNSNWIPTLATSIAVFILGILQPESRRNIRAFPRKVINAYRKVCVWRNWVFAKIEYLNGESAKWRRTFNVLNSPYSLLRACGLSPQAAIGLFAVTRTAGTGEVVDASVVA